MEMRKASNPNYTLNKHIEIAKELTRIGIRPIHSSQVTGVIVFDHKIPNWLFSFITEKDGIVKYK